MGLDSYKGPGHIRANHFEKKKPQPSSSLSSHLGGKKVNDWVTDFECKGKRHLTKEKKKRDKDLARLCDRETRWGILACRELKSAINPRLLKWPTRG